MGSEEKMMTSLVQTLESEGIAATPVEREGDAAWYDSWIRLHGRLKPNEEAR